MTDPIILIGLEWESGRLAVVGLYADLRAAQEAIGKDTPTNLNYSIMTPKLGSFVQPIPYPDMVRDGPRL